LRTDDFIQSSGISGGRLVRAKRPAIGPGNPLKAEGGLGVAALERLRQGWRLSRE
jgi:hypothetical protein